MARFDTLDKIVHSCNLYLHILKFEWSGTSDD